MPQPFRFGLQLHGPLEGLSWADTARHAEQQGFALRAIVEPELPPVRFDRDALVQVLFNLVDNACKYGKDAAGQATIELVAFAGEGEVALRVSDGGAGVPARERELIFGAFERGSRGGTEPNAGVGLGLALSAELASAMGGRLSIRNDAPGKGATFELLLPRG